MPHRFKNLPGRPIRSWDRWAWLKFLWKMLTAKPPATVPTNFVLPRAQVLTDYAQFGARDTLTWLGHAAFLVKLKGKTILLDPYLTNYASPLQGLGPKRFTPPGLAIEDLPPIDVIVISHNHYDHLDAKTIAALPNKAKIQVVVPLALGKFFKQYGYQQIHELAWYETWTWQDLTISALPAYHFSRRKLFDKNTTLWASYAISTAQQNIYFSGDTAYGPIFAELGQQYGPFNYALLGIGAYQPQILMQNVHITPEEAVQIGQDLHAKTLVGMHWGAVILTEEPPFEAPVRFKAAALAANIAADDCWVMKIGETRKL